MKHSEVGGKVAASGTNKLKPNDFSGVMYFGVFICFYMLSWCDQLSNSSNFRSPENLYTTEYTENSSNSLRRYLSTRKSSEGIVRQPSHI